MGETIRGEDASHGYGVSFLNAVLISCSRLIGILKFGIVMI